MTAGFAFNRLNVFRDFVPINSIGFVAIQTSDIANGFIRGSRNRMALF